MHYVISFLYQLKTTKLFTCTTITIRTLLDSSTMSRRNILPGTTLTPKFLNRIMRFAGGEVMSNLQKLCTTPLYVLYILWIILCILWRYWQIWRLDLSMKLVAIFVWMAQVNSKTAKYSVAYFLQLDHIGHLDLGKKVPPLDHCHFGLSVLFP